MRRALFVVAATGALLAACGDDGDATSTTQAATTATSARAPSAPSTTTTVPEVDGVAVDLTVRGGALDGEVDRIAIPVGERAVITVDTDADAEVHLHGYDLFADGGPGSPAVIEFDAAIPGIFELELEGSHVLLAEIEVS